MTTASKIATDLVCAECGGRLVYRTGGKFGPFYGCERWPQCAGAIGAHPDGSPLGIPGDAPTRAARIRAHEAFDTVWQYGAEKRAKRRRKRAYARLRAYLGMTKEQCHIGKFTAAQCARVIEFALGELANAGRPKAKAARG